MAATINLSLRYNIPYCIPKHTLNDIVWKPYRFENVNYCDGDFETNGFKFTPYSSIYREPSHAYSEIPLPIGNLILDGYFQSYKYFKDYLPEIRKAFGFDYSVKRTGIVALHHRLGDYRKYPTKHIIISDEYIRESLGLMYAFGYRECIIFSDEIEECSKIINDTKYPGWSFRYSLGRTDLEDMQEMINCESFIISASTFSLMASILNGSKNKICIAPKIWFGPENSHLETKDIVPENYIRL